MKKPMTARQALDLFDNKKEPIAAGTCSFHCKYCGTSNYFTGNLEDAPEDFRCVDCGYTIFNHHREPRYWHNPLDAPLKWGTTVVPLSEWIDPRKKYTCGGKRVENISIELCNSVGKEVTYPVKGTVIIREKPLNTEYRIWTLNGVGDLVWGGNDKDLVEVKE